jgi:hypothetical protein
VNGLEPEVVGAVAVVGLGADARAVAGAGLGAGVGAVDGAGAVEAEVVAEMDLVLYFRTKT